MRVPFANIKGFRVQINCYKYTFMENIADNSSQDKLNVPEKPKRKKAAILALAIVVAMAVGSFAALKYLEFGQDIFANIKGGGIVAKVNGERILKTDFDKRMLQAAVDYATPGVEMKEEEKKELGKNVLDMMVAEAVLLQDAVKRGIDASKKEITKQYDQVVTEIGGQEAFLQRLAERKMTADDFRQNVKTQLIVQKYAAQIQTERKVEIKDEEVKALYDNYKAQTPEAELFEKVEARIREYLSRQKFAELIQGAIEELRAKASVEILL